MRDCDPIFPSRVLWSHSVPPNPCVDAFFVTYWAKGRLAAEGGRRRTSNLTVTETVVPVTPGRTYSFRVSAVRNDIHVFHSNVVRLTISNRAGKKRSAPEWKILFILLLAILNLKRV